jgi:deoxyxylulose-5-phosphate synthase
LEEEKKQEELRIKEELAKQREQMQQILLDSELVEKKNKIILFIKKNMVLFLEEMKRQYGINADILELVQNGEFGESINKICLNHNDFHTKYSSTFVPTEFGIEEHTLVNQILLTY